MAELYDWAKDEKSKSPFEVTSTSESVEYTFKVKRVEVPDNPDKLIVTGVISPSDRYRDLKSQSPKKHKLMGSISTALNNALNRIAPNRIQKLGENTLLKPEHDGRLFFTVNGLKYYIDKSKTQALDEDGNLWMIDLANGKIYGGCETSIDFDYAFVSFELEKAFYDGLEKGTFNIYDSMFTRDKKFPDRGKVVDFESFKKGR